MYKFPFLNTVMREYHLRDVYNTDVNESPVKIVYVTKDRVELVCDLYSAHLLLYDHRHTVV